MNINQFNYPDDMDKECIAMSDFFNSIGLTTQFSCCGHNEEEFEIIFSQDVTNKQIESLIEKISLKYDHTPIIGTFLLWIRKCDGQIVRNWTYRADTIEWANMDLELMQKHLDT